MKKILISTILAASMLTLTACAVVPTERHHGGSGITVVPILPQIVVLEAEPYYFYNDFHYHYTNDRWYYSRSRSGPWTDLPRGHYPKEVRYKGKDKKHDKNRGKNDRHDDDRHDDDRHDDDRRYDGRGR